MTSQPTEKINVYYRICDKTDAKRNLSGATKDACLANFLSIFKDERIFVIADHCEAGTHRKLDCLQKEGYISEVRRTALFNAGSFHAALDLASEAPEGSLVYLVEDDYLHRPQAPRLVREGASLGEYVTLYDHPDKYRSEYPQGGVSRVFRTETSHWAFTISTCLTFATTPEQLRRDRDIWNRWTDGTQIHDHEVFCELGAKGCRLALCLPGAACHTDLTYSHRSGELLIDDWALDQMSEVLLDGTELKLSDDTRVERLRMRIDAIRSGRDSNPRQRWAEVTRICQAIDEIHYWDFQIFGRLSELSDHLRLLNQYSRSVRRIAIIGSSLDATRAILSAVPESLIIFEEPTPAWLEVMAHASNEMGIHFSCKKMLEWNSDTPETDLLFIELRHTSQTLRLILSNAAKRVRKYIILRDAPTVEARGGNGFATRDAVSELLRTDDSWILGQPTQIYHGLTILIRL